MKTKFDYSQFKEFANKFQVIEKEFNQWLEKYLLHEGLRALRLTRDETPVDTGTLKRSWSLSGIEREGDILNIYLVNPIEYASFVEDGYDRKRQRRINRNKVVYRSGAKTRKAIEKIHVEGFHMAEIAIAKVEAAMPARFSREFSAWLKQMGIG